MFSLRLDREASIYLIHPLMNLHFRRSESAVPILMYHSICQETHGGRSPYYFTNTSPDAFRAQMEFLHENGYSAISLEEALPILRGQTLPRRRIAVITFDDGCRSVLTEAYPVLCQFGFTATVFIATAFIKGTGRGIQRQAMSHLGRNCRVAAGRTSLWLPHRESPGTLQDRLESGGDRIAVLQT